MLTSLQLQKLVFVALEFRHDKSLFWNGLGAGESKLWALHAEIWLAYILALARESCDLSPR